MSPQDAQPRLQPLDRLEAQIAEQHQRLESTLRRRTERQQINLRRITASVDAHARHVDAIDADLAELRLALRSQAMLVRKIETVLPAHLRRRLWLLHRLERIAAGGRPIIVGPWTGEVGYEVLYWVPFVRWFVQQYRIDPGRVRVISRGGPVNWYQHLTERYVDALSLLSLDDFRQRRGALDWMKQDRISGFDRQILRRGRASLGDARAAILHPLLMFRLFKRYWGDAAAIKDVLAYTSHSRLDAPPRPPDLPARYVAVRFYFRSSFPDTPENRALVARTLSALTAHTDVVVLNPGFEVDDHHDYPAERSSRLHTIDHLLTPETNLEVQTAVIAGADAYIGSYGGFSYLAPLYGVKSVAYYSVKTFKTCHLELAEQVFDRVGGGSLTLVDTAELDFLDRVVPAAAHAGIGGPTTFAGI